MAEQGTIAGIIGKPFTGTDLISKVKAALEKPPSVTPVSANKGNDMNIASSEAAKPYDLSDLYKASAGDKTYVIKMLNLFLTTTYASMNNLKFHLKTGNTEQIGKTAHKMLGSFRQLGMEDLAEELKNIEKNCESGSGFETLAYTIEKLEQEFYNLKKHLTAEIHRINENV